MIPRVAWIKAEVFVGEDVEETEDDFKVLEFGDWMWIKQTFSDVPSPLYTFLHLKCVSFYEHTHSHTH